MGSSTQSGSTPEKKAKLGLLTRGLSAMARNRAFVDVMASTSPSMDRAVHRLTKGRATMFSSVLPTLMLVSTGSKTGQARKSPLLYVRHSDGSLIVIASNFGRDNHPAWSSNLISTPSATVVVDGKPIAVTAELLSGEDRETGWNELLQIWPAYAAYAERAGRGLRVFRLVPDVAKIRFTQEFDVTAETVWAHVKDFYAISSWQPFLSSSGKVGQLRRECIAAESGERFVEQLIDLGTGDDRFYRYHTIDGPKYVTNYYSTLRAHELPGGRSSITWEATFNEGMVPEAVGKEIFSNFLLTGLDALAVWAKRSVEGKS